MSRPDRIRDEIHEISSLLSETRSLAADHEGVALMRAAAKDWRDALRDELESAETPDLDVIVTGGPVDDETLRVRFLARSLDALQQAITAVGQSMVAEPTPTGRFPGSVVDATELRFSGAFAGSFGLRLRGPRVEEPDQKSLSDYHETTLFDASVDSILDILEGVTGSYTEPDFINRIARVGARAAGHLKNLSTVVVADNAGTTFRWRERGAIELRKVAFDDDAAGRLEEILASADIAEVEETLRATLVGLSVPRGWFELELEEGLIVTGRSDPRILKDAGAHMFEAATFRLRVITATSRVLDRSARSFTLLGLVQES